MTGGWGLLDGLRVGAGEGQPGGERVGTFRPTPPLLPQPSGRAEGLEVKLITNDQ